MIKSIEIINGRNEHTVLVLKNPKASGLFITKVEGLDAPKGTINMVQRSRLNGSKYKGSRANARNIVFYVNYFRNNLNKDAIEGIRHQVYRMCPIGEDVDIIVTTDQREVFFNGYVETNEANIFSQQEGSQISILCEEAYGRGETDYENTFVGVDPIFEFPFSNESLTDPLIEFGDVYTLTSKMFDYTGEVRTGFKTTVYFRENVTGFTLSNLTTKQSMKVNGSFTSGDVLVIDTEQGKKSVTLNGTNDIGNFYTNSSNDWVELSSGDNYLTIRDGSGEDVFVDTVVDIESPMLYQGV